MAPVRANTPGLAEPMEGRTRAAENDLLFTTRSVVGIFALFADMLIILGVHVTRDTYG